MTAEALPYTRGQVTAAIWWLVNHPVEMASVCWLALNDPNDANVRARNRLAERRRSEARFDPRRPRVHACPHCRCMEGRP